MRAPFADILATLKQARGRVVAVDIPSGWDVEQGKVNEVALAPDVLVSLTAPKLCAKHFTGTHFLGGRFVPPPLAAARSLCLPPYPGLDAVVLL